MRFTSWLSCPPFRWIECRLATLLVVAWMAAILAAAVGAANEPKLLYPPREPHGVEIAPDSPAVEITRQDAGLAVDVAGGDAEYPGFTVRPASGGVWDLSSFGHVEAKVTNTGGADLRLSLRVDNAGPWQDSPWNCEAITVRPGESKVVEVIFGFQYGKKPGYKLKPEAVTQLLFFLFKSEEDRSFVIEQVQAAGPAGETPRIDPHSIVTKPPRGVIFSPGAVFDAPKQLDATGGATASLGPGGTIAIDFAGGRDGAATLRPPVGKWSLGDFHQVRFRVKNIGQTHVTPSARVESDPGPTDTVTASAPLAPGEEATLVVPFAARTPWVGTTEIKGTHNYGAAGTGTKFDSVRVRGVTVLCEATPEDKRLQVGPITAAAPPCEVPSWLGRRPPADGDWVKTFDEEFVGDRIDLRTWNIYTQNYWDKRTHFSRDNAIVTNGKLLLYYERKTGFHNDDPNDKRTGKTDFACGFADTYGKWTQRYGYFEARMRLPTCPGLWPAFWLMPDRGVDSGPQHVRADTGRGGMEFDIMEHLTAWGPYRFNIAMHWDGYGENHRSVGSGCVYVPADEEGFITVGLLWLPGQAVFYGNGQEVGRWEHPRVGDVPSYIMFDMVSGGWANVPLDESKLPDDFVIDYVRVWQRRDLASEVDGPKPNDGGPQSQF